MSSKEIERMKLVYNARKYYLTCHIEGYILIGRHITNLKLLTVYHL